MSITESIRVALRALLSNKMRAILTMLGIIIGVGAVITLMSVGKGVEQFVQQSFEGLGSNLLIVFPGTLEGSSSTTRPQLTLGDYQAIADPFQVPDTVGVAPELASSADIVYGKRDLRTDIAGVTADYLALRNLKVAEGSFVTDADVNSRSRVAVLGSRVYEKLFEEGAYPIGQVIKINRIPFRVVGVMAEKGGSNFGNTADSTIYVPLTTAQSRLYPRWRSRTGEPLLSTVYVQAADESLMDPVADQVAELLRLRHKIAFRDEDDFTIIKQTDILAIANDITGVLTVFLGAIAFISLLVGGIGIMNIMLVSVTERTREIGIRKAVGAKRRDIRLQFLVEAMVLSLIGGLIGIALGIAGSQLVASLSDRLNPLVTWDVILLATLVSTAVGLFFGIYPAIRAASLNPIDALRYE
jgi:putative ABC transport system permease protein